MEVTGAVLPLADPVVTGDAPLAATFDDETSLLSISAQGDVPSETLGSVTVADALGQLATLSVTLLPGPVAPSEVLLTAEDTELTATDLAYTWIEVEAAELVDGTTVSLIDNGVGELQVESLTLEAGAARTLFFAGTTPGTAVLLAIAGETVSDPLFIEIVAAE